MITILHKFKNTQINKEEFEQINMRILIKNVKDQRISVLIFILSCNPFLVTYENRS